MIFLLWEYRIGPSGCGIVRYTTHDITMKRKKKKKLTRLRLVLIGDPPPGHPPPRTEVEFTRMVLQIE